MSMPPSGSNGQGMDEEAIIEAEIQFELDNINLDNDQLADNGDFDPDNHLVNEEDMFSGDLESSNEIDNYIKRIQDQTRRFEEELEECDELLHESGLQKESQSNLALIPYEDQQMLNRLACELGCSVEEYKKKILEEIEQDNFEIKDELAELITDETVDATQEGTNQSNDAFNSSLQSFTHNQEMILHGEQDLKLDSEIQKAVEEGVDPSEIPVSQDMLPTCQKINGKSNTYIEIQNKLREQLEKLEIRYEERLEKLKKEETFRKNEEEVREKRSEEERLWKKQELEREEQKLKLERELAERKIIAETSEVEKELAEQTIKFQREMAELEAEKEQQRAALQKGIEDERKRQEEKMTRAVLKIQSNYRGYRVRKQTVPVLKEKREIRWKEREEKRIKEVEQEMMARQEELKRKEEKERLRKEEEKRKEEDLKREKELEKQQREEEKRRKKEEEEQRKQEEKRRKEEEKQRKKEEERKKKEEEKRRKEEEEQKKKEEKRLKEEQEKQRKEEEKKRKEEEKRKKEEEKRQKEEEKKQAEEAKRLREEKMRLEQDEKEQAKIANDHNSITKQEENLTENCSNLNVQEENHNLTSQKENHVQKGNKSTAIDSGENKNGTADVINDVKNNPDAPPVDNCREKLAESISDVVSSSETQIKELDASKVPIKTEVATEGQKSEGKAQTDALVIRNPSETEVITAATGEKENLRESRVIKSSDDKTDRYGMLEKIQQCGHIPHPPSPRKRNKSNLESKMHTEKTDVSAEITKLDCLPDQLEALRLKFMKECQPWSKVSNEPWKLKTGLSRKPLRRPSSAKKLPLIPESVILQAASAASLQQVTTVQLKDLPGYNMSPLGQCWGLKYLSMNNCNLVAVDSLGQCKQLQYIDVKENRVEYLDLRDVGQLQYLNVSHNRLSSIHGIDNCSSLRWLDLSHNNIIKLGGLDTLRRLNTLILSHNQLISAEGLGDTPTLQMVDLSQNHLQEIHGLEKLCLLLSLDLSSNNLLMVPDLKNQVLLQELNLSDNSVSSLDEISCVWLPLLGTLNLSQNSISALTPLENCLMLKKLDLGNNQLIEFETIFKCVEGCFYLESLSLDDNPVTADLNASSAKTLQTSCPRLQIMNAGTPRKQEPLKPRTSFETMCLTQSQAYKDIWAHLDTSLKTSERQDLSSLCDMYYKYCEKTFNMAVEHRYAHEYGEISVTMPTAPSTPKSGRPKSGRQKDTFISPKDMFENALRASAQPNAINGASTNFSMKTTHIMTSLDSNPKDLFEQALMSAECVQSEKKTVISNDSLNVMNGITTSLKPETSQEKRMRAIVTIQAYWRGWLVRHEIAEHTKIWLAATTIQAFWRGHWVRKQLRKSSHIETIYRDLPADRLDHLNKSATRIQAVWRGYNLRRRLLAALEYAQCNFDDEENEDAMMFGDDFDLDKFVSLDQNLLEDDWRPPETPDIPSHHPVLKKPPSGRVKIPPIPLNNHQPPSNPRRAWRNAESPLTDVDKISRPPSSLASTELTARTGVSKKEERITEEWGFKDTTTAHLMMQRAKKMKYNAERRNKISKLDPRQRLALFRKLEEVTHPRTVPVPQRKTLPRKEYFKARQEEIHRQEREKQEEYSVKVSRTFEWLHTQVGDHYVSDSVINKGYVDGPRYIPENLPNLQGIRRVQLTSPGSVELQSVESVSSAGHKRRRSSAGSGSSSKLPPIQPSSAPAQHVKERMSFRNPKVNQSVGWGGGKKRGSIF